MSTTGGLPRRSETLPNVAGAVYGGEGAKTWGKGTDRVSEESSNPTQQWQGWMSALGDDLGELEAPPKRAGMLMLHGNHSSPSLRQSPSKPSTNLPAHGDDGFGLDRLRLADDSFTPPTRTVASLPSNPTDSAGMPPRAAAPPDQDGPASPEMRRGSTGGYYSAQGSLEQLKQDDRPTSGQSFGESGYLEGQGYGGIAEDRADARGSFSGSHPPPADSSGSGYLPPNSAAGPSYSHGYPAEYYDPNVSAPVSMEQAQAGMYPMQGYPYGQPQMMHGGAMPPQGFVPGHPGQFYGAPQPPMGYPGAFPPPPGFDPYAGQPHLNRHPSSVSAVSAPSYAPTPSMGSYPRTNTALSAPSTSSSAPSSSRRSETTRTPISKASIDEYRNRIKNDPDPEAHFNFAKFLIEAARRLASGNAAGDSKAIKKYRDALLQESLKLIKRLAMQGVGVGKPAYADAQFFLANCLGNGSLGLQVDHEKAYNLYVQASKQNHPQATFRTAVCNELGAGTRKDPNRAVLFFRKASALGDTAGMYKLGMILLNGLLGQQRNPKEALLWLKRAAGQADEDNPHSLHELGLLYEKPPVLGSGAQAQLLVPHDEAYARDLFTQAAQLGYAPAQNKLGSCYEYGSLTCPIDPRRSIAWYTRAAERGDAESELALSGWYLTGSEGVLKQSDSEAYLWARRAANKGLPKAEYAVGYYSEVGIGVKQDLDEAKRWYMRAASNGNKRAMQRLTELKKMGAQKPGKHRPTRDQAASECIIS